MDGKTQVHIIGDCTDYKFFSELCYLGDSLTLIEKFIEENEHESWMAGWLSFTVRTVFEQEFIYDYVTKEKIVVNKKYIDTIADIIPDIRKYELLESKN